MDDKRFKAESRKAVFTDGASRPAILVSYDTCDASQTKVWLNSCPHRGTSLDVVEGHFLDVDARYLVCATHGAHFQPDTGECIDGPCPRGNR